MKLGRNDPCHCGSGRKYKHCHLPGDEAAAKARTMRYRMEGSIDGAGLPGAHSDLFIKPLNRDSTGPYTVVFVLARFEQPLRPPDVLVGHEQLRGDSHLAFALPGQPFDPVVELEVAGEDGGARVLRLIANDEGRLSRIEVEHVDASSYEEARNKASRLADDVMSNISLMYDSPLEVFQIEVIDEKVGNRYVRVRTPFSIGIWDAPTVLGGELSKYAALYREGLSSKKEFYSFLCFYKIIDAVDEANKRDARHAAEDGSPARLVRQVLPEDDDAIRMWVQEIFPGWYVWTQFELANVAPKEARGKRVTVVRDRYLAPIRHAIAHGLLQTAGLVDVNDPELRQKVLYWLPYTRMMARRVLFLRCFPDSFNRPLIGITQGPDGIAEYASAVERAGGNPVPIIPSEKKTIEDMKLDGLVLSGGADIDPRYYGAAPDPHTKPATQDRDEYELGLAREGVEKQLPTLAICRGLQVANVAFGGSLHQHVPDFYGEAVPHRERKDGKTYRGLIPEHVVKVIDGSVLANIIGASVATGSRHHQSIAEVAAPFRVVAEATDGVIEALELAKPGGFWLGVQWHPESTVDLDEGKSLELFRALVKAARERAQS